MKASAIAYPIQGLIKYHGLKDEKLRLPYHDSISVCTAPIHTLTTVEFGHWQDMAEFDGQPAKGRDLERILAVVGPLRALAKEASGFKMVSENTFQSNIGLGASASGFAALAVATAAALGLDLSLEQISRYARRGAGSASRAVTGGFSRWYAGCSDEESYSHVLASPEQLDIGIVCALIPAKKSTDAAHKEIASSPFFKARLEYVEDVLDKMERAIYARDIDRICALAETDTLLLHSITMTAIDELVLWRPETVKVIMEVKAMRHEGIACYFSIDTGATVYINSRVEDRQEVERRIQALGLETIACSVGGESRQVYDHLF